MALVGLAACFSSHDRISADGSSTVFPITEAMAEKYRVKNENAYLVIGVSGTGGGFKKFARAEIDIANASRKIKPGEVKMCAEKGIDQIELRIAYDGLAVVAHAENDWLQDITIEELRKIWEPAAQNKILRWNQIRSEWPDREIHLYGPGTASGTFDYFTKFVVGKAGRSRGDFTASEDDNVLVQGIANDKNGLGFFGVAFFQENRNKLKLIAVDAGSGPVFPTAENILTQKYSPLSRPLYLYVSSNSVQKEFVVDFIRFYLKHVADIAQEVGYIAMSQDIYDEQLLKFERFVKENNSVQSKTIVEAE